jgi:hypothetical protein
MNEIYGFLSIEKAINAKFGHFSPNCPELSIKELGKKCVCGAPLICVCRRTQDIINEHVDGRHFCLNQSCQRMESGERQRVRSVKRGPIEHCPVCWRELDG